jgi:DNA-binding CsgD family transcriptional regulator
MGILGAMGRGAAAAGKERAWRIAAAARRDPARVAHDLGERIKELNCLYAIAQLAERHAEQPLGQWLGAVAGVLPAAWQYPETAVARIEFRGDRHDSPGYRPPRWSQSAAIRVGGREEGEVRVGYTARRPRAAEGPFLREERTLIEAVAERIGSLAARFDAERERREALRQLEVEREALRETNAALRAVLARIEEEKLEICRDLQANVEKILLPILHALEVDAGPAQRGYLGLLRQSLDRITAPFLRRVARACGALTPAELRVCDMVRGGLRSKEIARLRGVSQATVHRHREHIRRKLGLSGRRVNLTAHLQTLGG